MTSKRKGIILAGGNGTRLRPITNTIPKCLLPVYDKPMIYYSLSVMIQCEIEELLIITRPEDLSLFKRLLNDGNQWGLKIKYAIQPNPEGIAQALLIGEKFLKKSPCALMLGDNIFHGKGLSGKLKKLTRSNKNSILAFKVNDPQRFGVCKINKDKLVTSLEEKPKKPKSNYAVTGLYFYDNQASKFAKILKPSKRGELEITDLNKIYMRKKSLYAEPLGKGYVWFDAGTISSLYEASSFVYKSQKHNKTIIHSPEKIAHEKDFITKKQLRLLAKDLSTTEYGTLLNKV